jgi:CubicO group peptidase (beta-lactamase class C family)
VSAVAMAGQDEVFGFPTAWGLGYGIEGEAGAQVFGVGGIGGSHAFADPANGYTFALTKNMLTPSFETAGRVAAIVRQAVVKLD